MSKPNFFADLDVLNCLLGMQYDMKAEPAMDLTIDFQDLPFWFSLKSDRNSQTLTIYKQMELYSKDEKMAMFTASVVLDNTTGQAQVKAPQGLGENMAAFYIACRNLSLFAKEKGLEKLWGSSDPEQSGILLAAKGESLTWKLVSGGDRPELTVERMFGGTIKMRPYMDDFWDRSETEMMSLEDRIEKAEGGDKFAIAKLATAYLNGDNEVEQAPEKAAYWFRKEADLQDSEGAFNLGLLYAKGFGVERDFTQAAEWMEKAVAWGDPDGSTPAKQYREMAENLKKAEEGDAAAMFELAGGYMMLGGSLDQAGPGEDYAESLKWAQKAVDAGNPAGYWALALAYEHGRGVKQDDKKAVELYRKGAEAGNDRCQHSYGCRLINGEGVKKDAKAALKLFEESADQGYGLACKALGHMYETGEGVEPDFDKELEYFEKACEAEPNNAELLRHVGYQYTNLMDDPEKWLHGVERAAYWLKKAAEQGDSVAANGLGMYEQILNLHKEGKIKAGTSLDKCMKILSDAAKEEENRQKKELDKAEREKKEREAAERRRKEEEKQKAEEEKRKEQQAAYDKAMTEWRAKKNEAETKLASELEQRLGQFERNEKNRIENNYTSAKKVAESKLSEAQKKEKEASEKLSNLGFFAFSEKSEQKKRIQAAQIAVSEAKAALAEAEKAQADALAALPGRVAEKKTKLTRELEGKYPIPKEPARRDYFPQEQAQRKPVPSAPERRPTPMQTQNAGFKADILAWMEPDTLYTSMDIAESVPSIVAAGISASRVTAMMTQLVNDGAVIRTEDKRKMYYSLA